MYSAVLIFHSLLRWVVLLAGLLAVGRACAGWTGKRPWLAADNRAGIWFTAALDLQLLVGLLLHLALSPLTQAAMENVAATMQNPSLRFWFVEHPFGMVIALVLAHVGRVRIRRASTDASPPPDRGHPVRDRHGGDPLVVAVARHTERQAVVSLVSLKRPGLSTWRSNMASSGLG